MEAGTAAWTRRRWRLAVPWLLAVVLASGISAAPTEAATHSATKRGLLSLRVDGLPADVRPNVSVKGPDGAPRLRTWRVRASRVLNLPTGLYQVVASAVPVKGGYAEPTPASTWVQVRAGRTTQLSVHYTTPAPGSLTVTVTGLPEGIAAPIIVRSPYRESWTVTASQELTNLIPGRYLVAASSVRFEQYEAVAEPSVTWVTVISDTQAEAAVHYEVSVPAGKPSYDPGFDWTPFTAGIPGVDGLSR